MSRYTSLEPTLQEILRVIIPLDGDWEVRFQIIDDLRQIVGSIWSLRGATVEPYGSFVSDLFSRWGDLDISIEIPNGSHILSAAKTQKLTVLEDLFNVLKKRDGWHKLKFVSNARIPILLCKNTNTDISCDISINNLSGQTKSKMLFWLREIDGRFRQMVLLVKEWAKANEINDPKTGSFNSYCLTLLVIFHLQTCIPAILPPLQQIYPCNMVEDLQGVRNDVERQIEETCRENINRFNRFKERNPILLSELFVSFMAKFSNINSWASTQGICLHTGRWEAIESNMTWLPITYCLFIEDPFEQPSNTARTVKEGGLARITEAFRSTIHKLNSRDINPAYILPCLAQYETCQLLPRTIVNDPYVGYDNWTQPQINRQNRTWQAQARPQEKAQNWNGKRADKRTHIKSNISLNREKLVWRPQAQTKNEEKAEVSEKKEKQVWRLRLDSEKAQADKQATGEANAQRPARVSENEVKQIWRPKLDGKGKKLMNETS